MTDMLTGGCQCGRVRYQSTFDGRDGYWCHCRMCQRAVGNVAAAFITVTKDSVTFTAAEPDYHASSPFARRGFYSSCGTPISFDYLDSPKMDLTIGSLDDPGAIRLAHHFGVESRVPGWIAGDDRPTMRCEDYQPLADRWAKAGSAPG